MIKTIAISLFVILTSFVKPVQEQTTAILVFEGLEDEVYYFSNEEDFSTYAFKTIDEKASAKYDLSDKKYIGTSFKVTYSSEELVNEDNETYEELTLLDLTKFELK